MTFCSIELVPETSNVTVMAVLSYVMSTFLTSIDEPDSQFVNPEVCRTSAAKTPWASVAAAKAAPHMVVLAISKTVSVRSPYRCGLKVLN